MTRRLPHGYTNATERVTVDGRPAVRKRYLGPDPDLRRGREMAALTAAVGRLPVPALLSSEPDADGVLLELLPGEPGQVALERTPEAVLHEVGRIARAVPQIEVEGLPGEGVLVHGDFGPQNMLVDVDTAVVTAVLDWELAHLGDPAEDLAWAEWIVRTHHPHLGWALPALYDDYGARPAWPTRHAAMLAGCARAAAFVRRWEPGGAGERQWADRIARTQGFREL